VLKRLSEAAGKVSVRIAVNKQKDKSVADLKLLASAGPSPTPLSLSLLLCSTFIFTFRAFGTRFYPKRLVLLRTHLGETFDPK